MNANPDIRWKQRFENYEKALRLLREALSRADSLSSLEQEGAVQRFEFTLELGWKTLRDFLEHSGVAVEPVTPKQVVKLAFAAKIIRDGQLWIDMLDHRNLLSHSYDQAVFAEAVRAMAQRYLRGFEELCERLNKEIAA